MAKATLVDTSKEVGPEQPAETMLDIRREDGASFCKDLFDQCLFDLDW